VRPEISGRIDVLPVDIGDRIKKSAILFTLDDQDLQTEKAQRQIEIEGSSCRSMPPAGDGEDGAQLQTHRGTGEGQARVGRSLRQRPARARCREECLGHCLEQSRTLQKALQIVEDKLAKTKIVAPFDCTILTRPVSVGQAVSGASGVNSGTEVLTIADLGELIINAHINQPT